MCRVELGTVHPQAAALSMSVMGMLRQLTDFTFDSACNTFDGTL